ncbi:phosphate-starvation-inducible PsiE family protein [Microcoleus sp. FACHB-831]|uniref:phosphate-starvation-inducible PsiE family protein n=1 Tax=Microcoleus sp. FACHB-831 TaxID=2692827 RepID=UPI001686DFAA|nr:phosphate-starvation-inducible PsiE family protein [Microcoleus sp. FACHB-831]MBD1922690.1 phosphate-starvation-inducible PsiE family protein [Microcoleus sp. FACHB-831]
MKRDRSQNKPLAVWLLANLTTMLLWKKLSKQVKEATSDNKFLHTLEDLEGVVSKVLSVIMVLVILASIWNLITFLLESLFTQQNEPFNKTLFKTFGLFLNVLIALEILENITAYLKKHVVQVELVIVTSIIAVARKIIILDLEKVEGDQVIGLGISVLCLSIGYWIVRRTNAKNDRD